MTLETPDPNKRIRDLVRPPKTTMDEKRATLTGVSAARQNNITGPKSTYVFPSDLSTHFMAFMFHRFHYTGDSLTKTQKFLRTILLPVPANLQEQIQTQYNTPELGAVAGQVSDTIARGGAAVGEGVGNLISDAGEIVSDIADFDAKGIWSGLSEQGDAGNKIVQAGVLAFRGGQGAVAAGINRYFASAPNPHITALFQGVGLRTHNFTWKLAPRNATESADLHNIINSFRGSMLPVRAAGNLTLRFPDEVDIYISGSDHYLYHFKRAVIRNLTANYAPDGTPSFFAGTGAPTAINLNLDLLETTVHTRRDYEEVPEMGEIDGIGLDNLKPDKTEDQKGESQSPTGGPEER